MAEVLIIVLIAAAVPGFVIGLHIWQWRSLESYLRRQLAHGEAVLFTSLANRAPASLRRFLSMGEGVVMVTDARVLFARWIFAPFWRSLTTIGLEEITDIKSAGFLAFATVTLEREAGNEYFMPRPNAFLPFSGDRARRMTEALESAREKMARR